MNGPLENFTVFFIVFWLIARKLLQVLEPLSASEALHQAKKLPRINIQGELKVNKRWIKYKVNEIFGYYKLLFNTLDRKIEPYQNQEHQALTHIAMSVTFPDTKDFIM